MARTCRWPAHLDPACHDRSLSQFLGSTTKKKEPHKNGRTKVVVEKGWRKKKFVDYNIEICKVAHFSSYVSVSVKPVYGLLFPWGKRTSIACFLLLLAAGRRAPRRGVQFRLAFNLMISDCKKGALEQEKTQYCAFFFTRMSKYIC